MQRRTRKSDNTSNITNDDSGIALSTDGSDGSNSSEFYEPKKSTARKRRNTKPTLKVVKEENADRPEKTVTPSRRKAKKPRKQYICSVCNKNFLGSSDLRKHLRIHTDERPFACEQCPMKFRQSISLKNHIASIHGTDLRFTCELCKKSFPLKERLKLHMRIHSGEKPYSCSQCPKKFARGGTLRQHMTSHHGTKKFKCLECPTSFTSLASLRLHTKIHTAVLERKLSIGSASSAKGKEFHCKVCNKTLKGHLLQHMKSHENIRSHSCSICGLQFSQKSHLNVHQRMHSGERPYRCRVCWQAFGHSSVLKLHIRKHTGEKPFKCLLCTGKDVIFSQLPHLKNHMKVIHGKDKSYMCGACQEFFKTKSDLQIHADECMKGASEMAMLATQTDEDRILSNMRLNVAVLLKRISTVERLKQLGFEKRLIDNVIISALKLAQQQYCDNEKTMSDIDRFRFNIKAFLEWTIPKQCMKKFYDENKSVEDLLDELASSFPKRENNLSDDTNGAQTQIEETIEIFTVEEIIDDNEATTIEEFIEDVSEEIILEIA